MLPFNGAILLLMVTSIKKTSNLWHELTCILGIQVSFVLLYHQQTNGAVAQQHRTLKDSIKASLIQMGDTLRENWMSQLPFTLLRRRIAFQLDLDMSSSMLTLGASPAIPCIVIPSFQTEVIGNHELLKTLQQNAAQPPFQMSRH